MMKTQILCALLSPLSCLMADYCYEDCFDYTCFDLSFAPLLFQVHEEGLDYAIKHDVGHAYSHNKERIKRIPSHWDFGVRLDLSYNTDWIGILGLDWTYFAPSGKNSVSAAYPEEIFPIWTAPNAGLEPITHAKAKWNLSMNLLDLGLSVDFDATCFMRFTPSVSLSSALLNQKLKIAQRGGETQVAFKDRIYMKNDFWGIGPLFGLLSTWDLGCGFSLLGSGDAALLYGRFHLKQTESALFDETDKVVYLN